MSTSSKTGCASLLAHLQRLAQLAPTICRHAQASSQIDGLVLHKTTEEQQFNHTQGHETFVFLFFSNISRILSVLSVGGRRGGEILIERGGGDKTFLYIKCKTSSLQDSSRKLSLCARHETYADTIKVNLQVLPR